MSVREQINATKIIKVKLPQSIMDDLIFLSLEEQTQPEESQDYTTISQMREYLSKKHAGLEVTRQDVKTTFDSLIRRNLVEREGKYRYRIHYEG